MLARLTVHVSHVFDLSVDYSSVASRSGSLSLCTVDAGHESVSFSVARLRRALANLFKRDEPDAIAMNVLRTLSDSAVKRVGGTVTPIYQRLSATLMNDIERVTEVLSSLEQLPNSDVSVGEPGGSGDVMNLSHMQDTPERSATTCGGIRHAVASSTRCRITSRRRPSLSIVRREPYVVLSSSSPTVPSIVVHPPKSDRGSCDAKVLHNNRVPRQNSAFGDRLTVPNRRAFNNVFPPMIQRCRFPKRRPTKWKWTRGHWEAVIDDSR
ncbi:hypothetical protein FISHEDRAFT_75764 [Fistulina hepatica ATCC 64428]|uniref:Uncharacterized protein n=1 Tax=Fistulina hepatica ATCC 64428 TaxID=1128425 RepID=A0A0D7A6I6_9AGAR|nr:hypothetical protein FISHEDRAFT_75764 [Fistulina hepatica ATCC 64428]